MTDTRLEHDAFGDIEVPDAHLWGAQTQRSMRDAKQRRRENERGLSRLNG